MSKLLLLFLALPAFGQDPRQIILEVQKRQHSDSQRYEGTLEVTSEGNKLGAQLADLEAKRLDQRVELEDALQEFELVMPDKPAAPKP